MSKEEDINKSVKEIAQDERARIEQASVDDVELPEEVIVELEEDVLPVSDTEIKFVQATKERVRVRTSISKYYPIAKRFFDSHGYIRIKARGRATYFAFDVAYYLRRQFKLEGVITSWDLVPIEKTIDSFKDTSNDKVRYVFGIILTVSSVDSPQPGTD